VAHDLIAEAVRSHCILTDEEITALAEAGAISPFDPALLSGCSYDLRAGTILRSRNRARTFNLEKGEYYVESGECVTIETHEKLDFSSTLLFGFVTNKHSMLARGIFHPITKVDPGFSGPLAITLFNQGSVAEPIHFQQRLVALIIKPVATMPKRIYGASQTPSYRQGDIDIASIINEPAEPLNDAGLARMYGRPVARLYERVDSLERSVDAGLIKQGRERRARGADLAWRFVVALVGGAVALTGKYILDSWNGAVP
jgi:deoxycytidine triphosphate deaminase